MKLPGFKDSYHGFSTTASNNARQLAFAGIAFLWVFKTDQNDAFVLPTELFLPAVLLILALILELLHYTVSTAIWQRFEHGVAKANQSLTSVEGTPWFIICYVVHMLLHASSALPCRLLVTSKKRPGGNR